MLPDRRRYLWASPFQIYRGSIWFRWRRKASVITRDNVNAGYWGQFTGLRLARTESVENLHA